VALRVAFFGTSEFAATVLHSVAASPHRIVGVVSAPDRPSGRGRRVTPGPVSEFALARGLPLVQPETLRDPVEVDRLRALGADVFAVASYGLIFSKAALAVPPRGTVNAHGSLLPLLRGAAPIERAILAGFERTGVTIQNVARKVDAGAVYAAVETPIGPRETAGELHRRLAAIAAELLPRVLTEIERGSARPVPQDELAVTYAPPLEPHERAIRWGECPSMVCRRVRAFAPRPGAFALLPEELGRTHLKINEAEPADGAVACGGHRPGEVLVASRRGEIVVAASDGAVRLVTVQPEGKKPMCAQAFLSGHPLAEGQVLFDGMPACPTVAPG
jgi:methionyl-tRNA formyltransferase